MPRNGNGKWEISRLWAVISIVGAIVGGTIYVLTQVHAIAGAGEGHLELSTSSGGTLHMVHAEGWEFTARITAPATTLWDLPTGP